MNIALEIFVPVLTFALGTMLGLFYKYSDITTLKNDIKHLQENVNVMNVVDIASNIKAMKDSIIFTPGFTAQMATICSEHERMRAKIEENSQDITILKAQEDIRK